MYSSRKCETEHTFVHDFSETLPSTVLVERVAEIEVVSIETIMDRVEPWQCEHLDGMVQNALQSDDSCLSLSFTDFEYGYHVNFENDSLTIGVLVGDEQENARATDDEESETEPIESGVLPKK